MDSKELQDFVEGLYDENVLIDTYRQKKESRDELLKAIAIIMLSYNIIDGVMSLSRKDFSKESNNIKKIIKSLTMADIAQIRDNTSNVLRNTVESVFNFYSYNYKLKDVERIINQNFKGKHFSNRIWDNEQAVANRLNKQCQDFLQGKINVNQIKKDIEKTYNTSAYNAKRLVETEISRVQNESFIRFCNETGVEKIRYNSVLDANTCNDCSQYNGRIYDLDKAPELPRHPNCKCFYEIEDYRETLAMNLQLFGINERKEVQKLIDNGIIIKANYDECYKYFNEQFKNGVSTPIGTVYNTNDRFVHIARRHKNMISKEQIDNIISSLENPNAIYKTIDKFGIEGKGYVKNIDENELLTIVRNGIITSYYPSESYINKVKEGELIWAKR